MSLSLLLHCLDNRVEGKGVLRVEKVDLIVCDSREEPPFSTISLSHPCLERYYKD